MRFPSLFICLVFIPLVWIVDVFSDDNDHSVNFPFNVVVFLLSLCLHMLSMYVWFCPHHDNPSPPAEGKQAFLQRCAACSSVFSSYSVAPFIFPPLLALNYYHSKVTEEIRVVCVCVHCMESTKGTLGGESGIGHKTGNKGMFYVFRVMLRVSSM